MSFQIEHSTLKILLSLKSIDQIFDLRDPSPFREKDLDDDFARYLVVAAKEAPECKKVLVRLQLASPELRHLTSNDAEQAIRDYFEFEVESTQGELRTLFSEARWAMLFGTLFLVACQALAIFTVEDKGLVVESFRQGLQILGWVALWRPLNLMLYDWWPLLRKQRLFKTLTHTKVQIDMLERAN